MRCRISRIALLTVVVTFAVLFNADALVIWDYSSNRHDRFSSGYPGNPQSNTNFWLDSYDWSGVGWDANEWWSGTNQWEHNYRRSVAMISSNHFVCASHFLSYFSNGTTITFLNPSGQLKSNTMAGTPVSIAGSDLALGTFSTPFSPSDEITYYPVLWFDDWSNYLDRDLYVYGWYARAGHNTLDAFSTQNVTYCFNYDYDFTNDEARGQGGDSGSATFTPWGGQLTVLGTHYTIGGTFTNDGGGCTYDPFIPYYLDELNDAMGAGYAVTLVPEPSVFLLLAGGMMSLLACVKFRAKKA